MYPNLPLISWTLSLLTGELGGGGGGWGRGEEGAGVTMNLIDNNLVPSLTKVH